MNNSYEISFPSSVIHLTKILHAHGLVLYAVGGAIRDMLIHILNHHSPPPDLVYNDIDFTTDATPSQIMSIFSRTIPTGLQHGTVTVLFEGHSFEITTYRIESEYKDHRKPSEVHFSSSLKEDLARRDFTINAIACDPLSGEIIDLFEGIPDIKKRIVRCVGIASLRYKEDALRMLRTIRFASKLDFTIDTDSFDAILPLADTLAYISRERICAETRKMLYSAHPDRAITLLIASGLYPHIFGTSPHIAHAHIASHLSIVCKKSVSPDSHEEYIRWALCLSLRSIHPFRTYTLKESVPHAEYVQQVLTNFRMSNQFIYNVRFLCARQHYINSRLHVPISDFTLAMLVAKHGKELVTMLLDFLLSHIQYMQECSDSSQPHSHNTTLKETATRVVSLHTKLSDDNFLLHCITMKQMDIDGTILGQAFQRPPGKWVGNMLATLHRHVLRYPHDNNKDTLLSLAKTTYSSRHL